MFKGIVTTGSTVTVTFTAAGANRGSSSLLTGFLPLHLNDPTDGQSVVVAPGDSGTLASTVIASRAFDIHIDISDPVNTGTLEVFENGVLKDRETVGDASWAYAVA